MNNKKISLFADTLRDKLRSEVILKAARLGFTEDTIADVKEYEDSMVINGHVFGKEIKKQRADFKEVVSKRGYNEIIDEITYTWFNRVVALKFMSENGYVPVKVFDSSIAGNKEPDLLTKCLELDFMKIDKKKLLELKTKGDDEELYKFLILSLCNHLNHIMPFLFENINDYTELMFPEKLLRTDSILVDINTIIPSEDWKEVEVIGWLYQDYIAKEKDRLIESKEKYTEKQIDKVTQIFTPKWIVKYMVQNSLGRYWLESHPDAYLEKTFYFYLKSRDPNNEEKLTHFINKDLKVEEIKLIDPAMGSGHILVYAFEIFYQIYKSQGYLESEISQTILTKNLYGLEIDDRAGQLAQFALFMKARKYDSKLFSKEIKLNVFAIQETNLLPDDVIKIFAGEDYKKVKSFFDQFIDAKVYGSLIKVQDFDREYYNIKFEQFKKSGKLAVHTYSDLIENILRQAEILNEKHDVSVANPPYLNSSRMPNILKKYISNNYPETKSDLFSAFIELMLQRTEENGQIGMVTPFVWMFIKKYEWLREFIVNEKNISSLIQLEYNSFPGACVPVCTFTIRNTKTNATGEYIKLSEFRGYDLQPKKVLEAIQNQFIKYRFTIESQKFVKIPGSPIGYWVSDKVRDMFDTCPKLGELASPKMGLQTSDNTRFLRFWQEVPINHIGFGFLNLRDAQDSKKRWFPYNKGGEFRKWYGNNEYIVNWENNGKEIFTLREFLNTKNTPMGIANVDYYFMEGLTWSSLTSAKFSIRYSAPGFIFDIKGPTLFTKKDELLSFISYLNSKVLEHLIQIISPTIDYNSGQLANIPIKTSDNIVSSKIHALSRENIDISKEEWDSRETSWDFKVNQLIKHKDDSNKLEVSYKNYCAYWKEKFFKLHKNEEDLNQLFIDIYDLNDELNHKVPLDEITILKEESEIKDDQLVFKKEVIVKQLLSYIVGCIFGRYNPEKDGLILANQGETIKEFPLHSKFMPDADNIVPINDRDYFTDDVVGKVKEFLKTCFGAHNITENLDFIASGLKGSGSSEEKIRRYFLKDFYSDHCKMYNKKPIYWLFTSGKNQGFNALIYMHRYNKELLAKMRMDYLHVLQDRIDAKISMIKDEDARSQREKEDLTKQFQEMKKYDELLNHKASEYIVIDLDAGVTVNHAKFKGLVETI